MTVRELRQFLFKLENQDAVIDISSDEEGNSYGDIDDSVAEGRLKDGRKVYSLYPINNELAEERYLTDEELTVKN